MSAEDDVQKREAETANGCAVILEASHPEAIAFNCQMSRSGSKGLFGKMAMTFQDWIDELWTQWGDGREIADQFRSTYVAGKALTTHDLKLLTPAPGLPKALADLARGGLGFDRFDATVDSAAAGKASKDLTPKESELMALVAAYRDALEQEGLIEQGQALSYLKAHADAVFPEHLAVYCGGEAPVEQRERDFLDGCPQLQVTYATTEPPERLPKASEDVTVRFGFSSGDYARPQVLMDAVGDSLKADPAGEIAIACKDPLELFRTMEPWLTGKGLHAAARGSKPFYDTDFGRTYLAMRNVREDRIPWDKDALTDVLHSSFMGLQKHNVWKIDSALRGDRLIDRAIVLGELRDGGDKGLSKSGYEGFRELDDLVKDPRSADYQKLSDRYDTLAKDGYGAAYVAEQKAAVWTLYDAVELCHGIDASEFEEVLSGLLLTARVKLACSNYDARPGQFPQVRFDTQKRFAQEAPGSVSTLVLCDLTTEAYPLVEDHDAVSLLLKRFGIEDEEEVLVRERRAFSRLLKVPTKLLVLQRSLNDGDANPFYPSAMMEEFVDAYRDQKTLSNRDDIDNVYLIPVSLQEDMYEEGEEKLVQDVSPGLDAQMELGLTEVENGGPDSIDSEHASLVAFPYEGEDESKGPRLSPSQIETYLDCPYEWFVSRRLATTEFDEGFSPREQGTFLHNVFKEFYEEFGQKVTLENLDAARDVMGRVFDKVAEEQRDPEKNRPGNRLAAIPGTTEEGERAYLKRRVTSWLEFESEFLPGFSPVAFEYEINDLPMVAKAEDGTEVPWVMRGRVDRIDMDDKGNALVIDYKGSIDKSYCGVDVNSRGKEGSRVTGFAARSKVQALLYAQALEQSGKLALPDGGEIPIKRVVGALYCSYKRGNEVSGAFVYPEGTASDQIPTLLSKDGSNAADGGECPWNDRMTEVDKRVAAAIQGMRKPDLARRPIDKDACKYCPVVDCAERLSDESN